MEFKLGKFINIDDENKTVNFLKLIQKKLLKHLKTLICRVRVVLPPIAKILRDYLVLKFLNILLVGNCSAIRNMDSDRIAAVKQTCTWLLMTRKSCSNVSRWYCLFYLIQKSFWSVKSNLLFMNFSTTGLIIILSI